jgi:hypothetical protein
MASAFSQRMITTTIQEIERRPVTFRTREQAARLLEELRELYQSLSRDEQNQIREHILANSQQTQFIQGEEL